MTTRALDLPHAPTYLIYEDVDGLYVEMGCVFAIPRDVDSVSIDNVDYVVDHVSWSVYSPFYEKRSDHGVYPQQCAIVHLKRRRR